MTNTTNTTTTRAAPIPERATADHEGPPSSIVDRRLRTAGIAGLIWLALLVVTNLANGAVAPSPDASVDEVVAHLTDDRVLIYLVTAGFAVGIPFVVWFFAGLADVLRRNGRTQAALAGVLAVAAIFTMFGMAATTRLALVAAVETEAVDHGAVWTVWKLHDVLFGTNQVVIGVALLAFGLGGVAVGLLPRWITYVAGLGAAVLVVSGTFLTLPMAEGTVAALAPGLVGFLLWLVFVATASVSLVRHGR